MAALGSAVPKQDDTIAAAVRVEPSHEPTAAGSFRSQSRRPLRVLDISGPPGLIDSIVDQLKV
jgi:hypothetical protein